jgi:hypothetical protein
MLQLYFWPMACSIASRIALMQAGIEALVAYLARMQDGPQVKAAIEAELQVWKAIKAQEARG